MKGRIFVLVLALMLTVSALLSAVGSGAVGGKEIEKIKDTAEGRNVTDKISADSYFEVSIDSTNSPVKEGEVLNVTATVTNTGNESDSQEIVLEMGGTIRDSTSTTLSPNGDTQVSLSWNTEVGDGGDYTARVSSENDTDSMAVIVAKRAYFEVSIDGTNSPVKADEVLKVNATITNTGDESDTQDIVLEVEGKTRDDTSKTIEGHGDTQVTLTWETGVDKGGSYTVNVSSEDETDSMLVWILKRPEFQVSIDGTNSPVKAGEVLKVNATITNKGDVSGTQEIVLEVEGTTRDSTTETIEALEDTQVTLTWETGESGSYTVNVSSEDETDSEQVSVLKRPYFQVGIDGTNSPVKAGEVLKVNATITNTGDVSGTQDIVLEVGETTRDITNQTIEGRGDIQVTLSWETDESGSYTVNVTSEDDSDNVTVEVEPERYTLTIEEPVGEGMVEVDGEEVTGWPYEVAYDNGTEVELEAVPEEGWQFDRWTGDAAGNETTKEITIDSDKEITANFEEDSGTSDGGGTSGFTMVLLLLSVLVAAIYHEKRR